MASNSRNALPTENFRYWRLELVCGAIKFVGRRSSRLPPASTLWECQAHGHKVRAERVLSDEDMKARIKTHA